MGESAARSTSAPIGDSRLAARTGRPRARQWPAFRRSAPFVVASILLIVWAGINAADAAANGGPTVLGELPYQTLLPHQLDDRANLLVNAANGNVLLQSEDLNIAGTSIPLSITRYFNDQASTTGLPGHGQTLSFGPDVHVTANSDGSATYQGPSGFQVVYPSDGNGGYTVPPAYNGASLAKVAGGGWKLTFHQNGEVYTFNSAGNETSDASASGAAVTYAYDSAGALSSATDTQGRVVTFAYHGNQYTWQITDPSGREVIYWGNGKGQLTDVYDAGPNEYWEYTYSAAGDLASIDDPMGNKITLAYNGAHQVTSITYPGAITYSYAYNAGSTVVTDPLGHKTTYDYDSSGRVTQIVDADGNSHGQSWSGNNNVTSAIDPSGAISSYSYDALNNLTAQQNPNLPGGAAGATTSYSYGSSAHPYSATSSTDTQGNQTAYSYDTSGNLNAATNTASGGSGMGVLASLVQGDPATGGGTVNCGGQAGETCSTIDANGNVTTYGYDAKGNLTTVTPPGGVGKETIGYDSLSRPITLTDGNGNPETITYDTDDRTTEIKSPGVDVTYTYDYNGNLEYVANNGTTTEYYYDDDNRLEEMQQGGVWIEYAYDKAGNLTSESEPDGTTTYSYDAANFVTAIHNSASNTTEGFGYTHGRPTTVTLPGGITETIGYDQAGRETSIKAVKGSSTLTSYSGTYTSATGADTELLQSETNGVTGITTRYSYDGLNRLSGATQSGPGTLNSYAYSYDLNGNLTQVTHNGVTGPALGYNADNELTSVGGSSAGGYDASGNETLTQSGLAMAYDADDQTTSFTPAGSGAISAGYASDQQTMRTGIGATSQVSGLLGLYSDTTGGQTTYYTHLPNGEGQTLSETIGSSSYYYLPDLQGSVVAVTDNGGTVQDSYSYDPYGNSLSATASVPNPWRFDDGYYDAATGLYKLGARYYNPSDGRWTQLDPSGQNPGYAFAADNPVNEQDPSGTYGIRDAALDCARAIIQTEEFSYAAILLGLPEAGALEYAGSCAIGIAGGYLNSRRRFGGFGWEALNALLDARLLLEE
jgi:RHS repeat-associated protein